MNWRGLVTTVAVCGMLLVGAPVGAAPPADDVRDRLEAVPDLTVVGERPTEPGFRLFDLTFTQPADHRNPAAGQFQQRLTLLHRDLSRPTVLYASGYDLPEKTTRTEPTRLVDGNQVSLEHRFFTPSRPDPADWGDLDIWQAATDQHRVISALRAVYDDRWITTGASKGGMTAVYHRRFYPDDVDGTVAYVAPNDVDNDRDRYDEFLAGVGTDPACRAALTAVQREALVRRGELVAKFQAYADAEGLTFDRIIGDIDRGFEMTVIDTPFAFWQYRGQDDCAQVPATTASTDEIYAFFDQTTEFRFYTDQGIEPYAPYYYQAGTQLGWPHVSDEPLADLLHNRELSQPRNLVSRDIPMRFEPGVMHRVDAWVRSRGSELMFVNGERDPWSAEPFELGPGTRDSYSYLVPGANHGAKIEGLPADQQAEAEQTLRRWAEVEAPAMRSAVLDAEPLQRHPR
ncbi:PS-10 peptidase S37 [Saccharopolyspora antimicrobica]|uniref:PS-10 peptidase S37 n=1 Tax=Saccharopolyspora antimicrobica TaxID=455193 RepID=A0A1I5FDH3_9PSEU|nr:S28 family serine protease [Saccharopolyspora antimicrobica]RKT82086.1 PS-10 peptidase S37 [Saccharopolyspora antimicrobica]SFO21818.1 PS-10 peptidase S37 [Saccharopolyspora antimicrobica]